MKIQYYFQLLFVITLPAAGLAGAASRAPTNGTQVFDRHFRAVGGRAALEQITNLVVRGAMQEGGQSFALELDLSAPGRVLMILSNGGGLEIQVGRSQRTVLWRKDPRGVQELPSQQASEFMHLAPGLHIPSQLGLSQMLAQAVCSQEQHEGRDFIALGGGKSSPFPKLLFDAQTGLLQHVGNIVLSDYREVNGLKMPFAIRIPGNVSIQVKAIAFNQPLDEQIFEKPEGKQVSPDTESPTGPTRYQTLLSPTGKLEIVRRPRPLDFGRGQLASLPTFDPKSSRHAQVDLRGYDLSGLDVCNRLTDLLHADFDHKTRWPAKLPAGFEPARILSLGQDPGLRVRQLHAQKITGKGVGLGIIDQALLVDHVEYRDRLRLYEEIHNPVNSPSQMHGPAVASIAVGKTLGVAPEADLYYIAEQHGSMSPGGKFDWDFIPLAQSIQRLLDVNATLPASKKIRVISISVGWGQHQKGYAETMAAVERANKDGVFIVSTSLDRTHGLAFHGLGREVLNDPNQFESFGPGSWWAPMFWEGLGRFAPNQRLLVPMDSRTTASPSGPEDYVFYWSAGWSWSVPWIAGLYALACQVRPDLTPELFWAEALKTGKTIRVKNETQEVEFGTLADPVALIESLKQKGPE